MNTSGHCTHPHFPIIVSLTAFVLCSGGAGARAQTSQTITLQLSPTALNVFNFGPHSFKVQYPPGTTFSGIFMTVTASQISQSTFHARVAGTQFANALCVVYSGESGFCIDFRVTCASAAKHQVVCPRKETKSITVESSFDTSQAVTNPVFLDAPNDTNSWTNILFQYFQARIDPTPTGHTNGFSEFVVAALGATNLQGAGQLKLNAPLRNQDARVFPVGTSIPVSFTLASTQHPGAVTDAIASLSIVMTAGPPGTTTPAIVFSKQNAFVFNNGSYTFTIPSKSLRAGTYSLTVYGNAFTGTAVSFNVQ